MNSPLLCFSSSLQLQLTLISACLHFFSSPCITVYLSASLTSRFFLFTFFPLLNLSMSHSDIVLNWQFLFSLAANSINKMPSPQLSFPITAPLLVRMRVGPRLLKVFLCAGCWIKWTCSLCDKTCSSSPKKRSKKKCSQLTCSDDSCSLLFLDFGLY